MRDHTYHIPIRTLDREREKEKGNAIMKQEILFMP
jgi:hypothetical protein